MPAYLIADVEVTDPAGFDAYRKQVPATLEAYGGRYVVRGGASELLEGTRAPHRVVVLEFPDSARLKAWWESPAYVPLRVLRERSARSTIFMAEGTGAC